MRGCVNLYPILKIADPTYIRKNGGPISGINLGGGQSLFAVIATVANEQGAVWDRRGLNPEALYRNPAVTSARLARVSVAQSECGSRPAL